MLGVKRKLVRQMPIGKSVSSPAATMMESSTFTVIKAPLVEDVSNTHLLKVIVCTPELAAVPAKKLYVHCRNRQSDTVMLPRRWSNPELNPNASTAVAVQFTKARQENTDAEGVAVPQTSITGLRVFERKWQNRISYDGPNRFPKPDPLLGATDSVTFTARNIRGFPGTAPS
jgi:hypothetical protein